MAKWDGWILNMRNALISAFVMENLVIIRKIATLEEQRWTAWHNLEIIWGQVSLEVWIGKIRMGKNITMKRSKRIKTKIIEERKDSSKTYS